MLVFSPLFCIAQQQQFLQQKYYIVDISNNSIYLDITSPMVKKGDVVEVYSPGGYMEHPVTKQRILRNDVLVGLIEITQLHGEYSVAKPISKNQQIPFEVGMFVAIPAGRSATKSSDFMLGGDDRIAVLVTPAEVNDVVNVGHFGGYVADMLMEHLLMNDKIKLLDRGVLSTQLAEMELTGSVIEQSTAIQQGKVMGARYVIQCTMQKPDVQNVQTGIPLASIMGAVGAIAGQNIGAQYMSNVTLGRLKSAVSISTRVIDLQTSEVMFMTNAEGSAEGETQIGLEQGALNGLQINGGAAGFKQTVTGQAIEEALETIGGNLKRFFNGETKGRVMNDDVINSDQEMIAKGNKLYIGTKLLEKKDLPKVFSETPELYFKYKSGKRIKNWGIFGGGALLFGCVLMYPDAMSPSPTVPPTIVIAAAAIGAASIPLLIIRGNRKIKSVASEYNTHKRLARKSSDMGLNLALVPNGVGLRLTF